ncbi:unnamed protein product, partial [Laminaria digitata]
HDEERVKLKQSATFTGTCGATTSTRTVCSWESFGLVLHTRRMISGKQPLERGARHCCTPVATTSIEATLRRRQAPSAYRRVQRAASLVAVVALSLCSTASSFVVSNPPAHGQATLSQHSARSSSSGRVTVEAPRDRPRRQRPSGGAASMAMTAATGTGDADSGGMGATAIGLDGIAAGEEEVVAAGGVAGGGASSLLALSSAPARTEIPTDVAVVGAPQQVVEKEYSIEAILKELAEIQNQGPKNYCVLGTRHCSFLHQQQIIELLAYALVLSGNHVFTSGAMGTNAATIRGALRAERKELLTVVLPQSLDKQSEGSRDLIQKV